MTLQNEFYVLDPNTLSFRFEENLKNKLNINDMKKKI